VVRHETWSYSTWFGKWSNHYAYRNFESNSVMHSLMFKCNNAEHSQWFMTFTDTVYDYWHSIWFRIYWHSIWYDTFKPYDTIYDMTHLNPMTQYMILHISDLLTQYMIYWHSIWFQIDLCSWFVTSSVVGSFTLWLLLFYLSGIQIFLNKSPCFLKCLVFRVSVANEGKC